MKVLFVCKKRHDAYGVSYGLLNSARFVSRYLNEIGIESTVVTVVDGNSIDKVVTEYDPTHVFIEAIWVTPAKFKELLSIFRHKKRKWICRIHSKLPFLASEGVAIKWIKEYIKEGIDLAPNTKELCEQLENVFCVSKEQIHYLPNIYNPEKIKGEAKYNDDYIHIGCFGAIRPLKNQLLQAVSAMEFGNSVDRNVAFHVNGNIAEENGQTALRNLIALFENTRHKIVLHNWRAHPDFLKLVSTMDLGMQVSLSESFNIVTADFVEMEVPIVVSPDVEWMPFINKAQPNSSESIVYKLSLLYYFPKMAEVIQRRALHTYNHDSKKVWKHFAGA